MPSESHKPLRSFDRRVLQFLLLQRLGSSQDHCLSLISREECDELFALAAMLLPESHIVEIGSAHGGSTKYLLGGAYLSASHLHCVDPWEPCEEQVLEEDLRLTEFLRLLFSGADRLNLFEFNLQACFGVGNPILEYLQTHQGTSEEISKTWDSSWGIDMLFIDGDHRQCRQDVELWVPHLQPWAVILFHDVDKGGLYGVDSPDNTVAALLQKGEWKLVVQPRTGKSIAGLSRDPEYWSVRYQDYLDTYGPREYQRNQGNSRGPGQPTGN